MKRKVVKTLLSVSVAVSMVMSAPVCSWAAQSEQETESTAAQEEKKTVEDITLALEDGELVITNQTERSFTTAELKKAEKEEAKKADQEILMNLVLSEENGDEHTFEKVDVDSWTDPLIYDEYGFLYITYKDADGNTKEVEENADEKELEGELTMYASSNVHIREKADQESESLKVLQLGDEATAVGVVPGWIKVKSGDITGYVYHSYITENKEKVDALVQEKKEAEAAAQAAAEAAAQAAAEQAAAEAAAQAAAEQAAQQQQQQTQEVYEVSRQQFDDCDGSGHGYYEITYSDGSVAYEEY